MTRSHCMDGSPWWNVSYNDGPTWPDYVRSPMSQSPEIGAEKMRRCQPAQNRHRFFSHHTNLSGAENCQWRLEKQHGILYRLLWCTNRRRFISHSGISAEISWKLTFYVTFQNMQLDTGHSIECKLTPVTRSSSTEICFCTLWPCDLDIWPFDLILNG